MSDRPQQDASPTRPAELTLPRLSVSGDDHRLESLYRAALDNVFVINTSTPPDGGAPFVRAGGDYPTPWTRDAAINAANAVSLLRPDLAESTLRAVVDQAGDQGDDRGAVIAQDNQWWDQAIWILGAAHHSVITGDVAFAQWATGVGKRSLDILEARFDPDWKLYRGPAVMQDGISGYPFPEDESAQDSSFVLDHPPAHLIMCLSTNLVYLRAHKIIATSLPAAEGTHHRQRALDLQAAINDHLWSDERGRYGYFLHPDGTLDDHQELIGLALAIEHGVADENRKRSIIDGMESEPRGLPLVAPHFARYDNDHPGRHNTALWPMAMGFWGAAMAKVGEVASFTQVLDELVSLVAGSEDRFFEVYHPRTGAVDGGWQTGRSWPSVHDQTWSATALLRLVHEALLGIRVSQTGLEVSPVVPECYESITLSGLNVRSTSWTISVKGHGSKILRVELDQDDLTVVAGSPVTVPDLPGPHELIITLTE